MTSFVNVPKQEALDLAAKAIKNISEYRNETYNLALKEIKEDYRNNLWNKLFKKQVPSDDEIYCKAREKLIWQFSKPEYVLVFALNYNSKTFNFAENIINIFNTLKNEETTILCSTEKLNDLIYWSKV